eukprot:GHRR01025728.1.p1 GENE.GHRR01025728.1~~GHRR01025728.1.p1  ORF type:complete len:493 (+),score=126.94 GHRR01025728.1:241-1719(+)
MTGARATRAFQVVVAATRSWGIGKNGELPFELPGDMQYFKKLTSQTSNSKLKNAVIMGRKTFLSIPEKFRPLRGRLNIILTSTPPHTTAAADADGSVIKSHPLQNENYAPPAANMQHTTQQKQQDAKQQQQLPQSSSDLLYATSLEAAMQLLEEGTRSGTIESVFVIGGGQVYREAVASQRCSVIHLTHVDADPPCDVFFPDITAQGSPWRVWSSAPPKHDNGVRYQFLCYTKEAAFSAAAGQKAQQAQDLVGQPPVLPPGSAGRHEEFQYLDLVWGLIEEGVPRGDRTGTGTLSHFGVQHRYDLRHSFPLLTSKRVFWKGVVEELLWFIRGSTNAKELQDKGVHIWAGNSSRAYLDAQGLSHREEGDLGPVYGFQWRHFGAAYQDMHSDYTGQGVDQLAQLVERIKSQPECRRLILTAWNPAALRDMALPPCHTLAQVCQNCLCVYWVSKWWADERLLFCNSLFGSVAASPPSTQQHSGTRPPPHDGTGGT